MVDTIRHNGAMYLSRSINIAALMSCAISLFVLREIAKLLESSVPLVSTNIGYIAWNVWQTEMYQVEHYTVVH